jgi:ABC-2 type transport system ATP-binding protein
MPSDAPALSIRGLTKRYDDGTLALDGLDLEVPSGEFFGLLGPNGAGKTTLINAVCNLIRVTEGEIEVFGCSATAATTGSPGSGRSSAPRR